MRKLITIALGIAVLSALAVLPTQAFADGGGRCLFGKCTVTGGAGGDEGDSDGEDSIESPTTPPQGAGGSSSGSGAENAAAAQRRFDAAFDRYSSQLGRYNECVAANPGGCGAAPNPPPLIETLPTVPTVTPAQAGGIAVARLRLPTVAPGIGPSPDLNRWKMAAVGYPLWLWADGRTNVGPVSDSVVGMTVTIDARVTRMTFSMGDGQTVECAGTGTRWTSSVEPGQKSSTCGYTYTKASLPVGPYTVRAVAYWAVRWTAGGQSGVINVPVGATAQLPVGELQSVITG